MREGLSLFQCIETISDLDLQNRLSLNAKKVYADSFEFNKVYDDFILFLESFVKSNVHLK